MSWQRVDLTDDRYAIPAEPPRWCGLVYAGKRHLVSGPPESAKSLLAWVVLQAAMRDGATVAAVDFEQGPTATRLLLVELGFTLEEIAAVHYFEPDTEPQPSDLQALIGGDVEVMLIDALAGAYHVSALDDGKRVEVEKWQNLWTRPLHAAGIATIAIDHVVKNVEARGNYSIGSERKLGSVDVHLGLEVVKPLTRGGDGLFKAHVRKDRPAYLRAAGTREIELHSDPDTHAITWTIRETGQATTADGHWQPTVLMQKVSEFLAEQDEAVSRNTVERGVRGKSARYVRQALDELVGLGHVEQTAGKRGAQLVRLTTPYTTASDRVPTASDALDASGRVTASTASPSYRRDADADAVVTRTDEHETPDAVDELDRLFHDHADIATGAA